LQRHASNEATRRMGPRLRGDDAENASPLHIELHRENRIAKLCVEIDGRSFARHLFPVAVTKITNMVWPRRLTSIARYARRDADIFRDIL
jgi:hypothetical protein